MGQNRSPAVMAQRAEAHDSLDDFPTPPWATRALIEHVLIPAGPRTMLARSVAWDPACNRGFMARPLAEYFRDVRASDIEDYGFSGHQATIDFLWPGSSNDVGGDIDWVITNPPFRLAEQFIERAFDLNLEGFAFLMRTSFLESEGRHAKLFCRFAPTIVAQFSERVVMHKGKVVDPNFAVQVLDKKTGRMVCRKPSTATSYMWFAWLNGRTRNTESKLVWIPPCREQLERGRDYIPEAIG